MMLLLLEAPHFAEIGTGARGPRAEQAIEWCSKEQKNRFEERHGH